MIFLIKFNLTITKTFNKKILRIKSLETLYNKKFKKDVMIDKEIKTIKIMRENKGQI